MTGGHDNVGAAGPQRQEDDAPTTIDGNGPEGDASTALAHSVGNRAFARALSGGSEQPARFARAPAPVLARDKPKGAPSGVLPQVVPFEWNVEAKGPKPGGYIKVNKAYWKGSGKLSVSGAQEGSVSIGPSGGAKTGESGTKGQVGVSAEAKKTAQTELNKKFDEMVNNLIKSVTDKDDALKTEMFAKAKAEAKGGKNEASISTGFDFGVDATLFGVGKGTLTGKLTLASLKYKASEKPPVSASVLAAGCSGKLGLKWKKAFELMGTPFDVEGASEVGIEIEPNWAKIAAETASEAAIGTAIDAAMLAGPPLLAAVIIGQGIYMAGEKGKLFANINEGALDTKQAAMTYAQIMSGSDLPPSAGPRTAKAAAEAKAEIAGIASRTAMTPEEVMTELRQHPASDFSRIYSQARNSMYPAYGSEVGKVIGAWREEHYLMAIWTRQEDDVSAAMKQVNVILR